MGRKFIIAALTLAGGSLWAPQLSAQSDGSIEEAYAQQCPQQQTTQICDTLRKAMEGKANPKVPAGQVSANSVWGPLAELAGSTWRSPDGVSRIRWIEPGRSLEYVLHGPQVSAVQNYLLGADGLITSEAVFADGRRFNVLVSSPQNGMLIEEWSTTGYRNVIRYKSQVLEVDLEKLEANNWVRTSRTISERLEGAAADAALANAQRTYSETVAAAAAKSAQENSKWGILSRLSGSWWRGPNFVWIFEPAETGKAGPGIKDAYLLGVYKPTGERVNAETVYSGGTAFALDKKGKLRMHLYTGRWEVPVLPDNSIYIKHWGYALIPSGSDTFDFVKGSYGPGGFVPKLNPTGPAGAWDGRYVRIDEASTIAFNALVGKRAEEAKLAKAQRKSQGGGLLGIVQGAIAGAAGMANGGGGMDSAIAGAAAGAFAGAAGVDANSIQGGFQQGASEVNASNAELQRGFERSMAAAGAPGYGNNSSGANKSSGATNLAGAGAAGANKAGTGANLVPLRVYFWVPMVIQSGDTSNVLCYSDVVTSGTQIDLSASTNEQAVAAIEPLRSRFLNKCRQYRELDGNGTYSYLEVSAGKPFSPPFRTGAPNIRVTMP